MTTIAEILYEGPAEIAAQIANLGGYVKTKPPKGCRRQWVIQCPHPSHPDLNPSATLSEAIDGTALMYCFGGTCNSKPSDVWFRESTQRLRDRTQFIPAKPRSSSSGSSSGGIEVATYVYHDPAGNTFHKIRYDLGGGHKRFQWRTIKGATYIVGLLNTALEDLLPYGSEQLADRPGQPVLWVEGEKDADRAHQLGLLALSSAGGAAGPLPDLTMLTGRVVKIVADRDPAGLHHARQVLEAIKPYASEYSRIVGPAPRQRGSDLTDHLDAGHTINELEEDPNALDTIEPPTDDTQDASPYDSAVQRRFAELRINEDAKQLLATHKAGEAHPLDAINLTEFLTQPDETEQYRVTGLWPAQGRVLLAAAAKSGKTTIIVGNLLPSLVDGRAFLGEHSCQQSPDRSSTSTWKSANASSDRGCDELASSTPTTSVSSTSEARHPPSPSQQIKDANGSQHSSAANKPKQSSSTHSPHSSRPSDSTRTPTPTSPCSSPGGPRHSN